MSIHNFPNKHGDPECEYPAEAKLEYCPALGGYMRGWGAAAPTDAEWGVGAIFVVVNTTTPTSTEVYMNKGTLGGTPSWEQISNAD